MEAAPLTLADQLIRLANVDVVVDRAVRRQSDDAGSGYVLG